MTQLPDLEQLLTDPVVAALARAEETAWFGAGPVDTIEGIKASGIDPELIAAARERFNRFAPWFAERFADTRATHGILESPLVGIPDLQEELGRRFGTVLPGKLWLKRDDSLPVSGSIKARGGIHEVLEVAERLATEAGIMGPGDDARVLMTPAAQEVLSAHGIAVGSTGNLGLSIGIVASELGFNTTVHMSLDARAWKKDLLRSRGVTVVEHAGNFSDAVEAGRKTADEDPSVWFVDDEASLSLFAGYSVAGSRLAGQLKALDITVDAQHPLIVHLPCGVGGGPGGVTFGLKEAFGDAVHCVFSEPTHSPCMSLGVRTGLHDAISVQDIGLDGKTAADGLAVGRPSRLVGEHLQQLIDGFVTVTDERMKAFQGLVHDTEGIDIEPSAAAGFAGPWRILENQDYLTAYGLTPEAMANATHIVWATGGSMVPKEEMAAYVAEGQSLIDQVLWS
ncbi:D-serine ammonia-lyase [Paeniglutamicibacter psychrophenolicus]|uniref:Probable D-serine dehydratase n=1 Tax=Paeniglutamicibacter psychrophenolicus TaxID=257454 RepID=A0ABS4W9I4_9MICC|nr:D-serine ammonia-lyase [Paeniglutamicibacter psychrophenolicus]MBP2372876.1 D-serine dehydratase [Paeniglutamicibacter psychrophenolicus]